MTFLEIYGVVALVILGYMTLIWILSLILKNSSIVDIFWGAGFVLANWVYFALTPEGFATRKWLLNALVTIWGLRLSIYILIRNWGQPEDYRYRKWREDAGSKWWWYSFFKVFLLQGFLMWIISTPLLAVQINPTPDVLTVVDYIAVVVWGIGFFFEAVGDWQLRRFKSKPENEGKVLNSGVWRYTRHPNYFGDATQWWGYYLLAAAAGGWWTIFSPIIMTFFLLRVSGVAMLEKNLRETKPKYKEYIETTSAFVPWFGFSKRYRSQNAPRHSGKALTRRQGNRPGLMKSQKRLAGPGGGLEYPRIAAIARSPRRRRRMRRRRKTDRPLW